MHQLVSKSAHLLKLKSRSARRLLLASLTLLVLWELVVLLLNSSRAATLSNAIRLRLSTLIEDEENSRETLFRRRFPGVPAVAQCTGGHVDCRALVDGDTRAQLRAHNYMWTQQQTRQRSTNADYLNMKCERFLDERRYVRWHTSDEEDAFPMAFAIVMYKDVEQFERLLRAVYRPQNLVCVHVDRNAAADVLIGVLRIAQCLNTNATSPRVLVPIDERVRVTHSTFSVLEAELVCMRALLRAKSAGHKWKYFINLTGQEFPLRTNLEFVRILRSLNGANIMEADWTSNRDRIRRPDRVPHGLFIYKGSVHIVASEGFVEFAINDKRSLDLLKYLRNYTHIPDEFYFSTLNHNPKILRVPGAYTGRPKTSDDRYPFFARLKNWGEFPCRSGLVVRGICIWGIEDLPLITSRPELVANKFYSDFQPLTLDCLEEWYWNCTAEDYMFAPDVQQQHFPYVSTNSSTLFKNSLSVRTSVLSTSSEHLQSGADSRLDLRFYSSLDVVRNHL